MGDYLSLRRLDRQLRDLEERLLECDFIAEATGVLLARQLIQRAIKQELERIDVN